MALRARLKVVRRGASHAFDRHEPSTFLNGVFLFMTIVCAFLGAERVDDVAWYVLSVAVWLFLVYSTMFTLLSHVMELEEKLAESDESLQAIREQVTSLPILGLLPFVLLVGWT